MVKHRSMNSAIGAQSELREAIDRLPWRAALPADGMPPHEYVILGKCPTEAWDILSAAVRDDPDSYDAYFRGYPWPMHYWEFEGHRFWRTSGKGPTHMLNRSTLDSVEPPDASMTAHSQPRRGTVHHGHRTATRGLLATFRAMARPHLRGMVYRADEDPRAAFPCDGCGITYWLYEPTRPCPRCGAPPSLGELGRRGLG